MPPATCRVVPDGLLFDHGLTLSRPRPVRTSSRNSVNAQDTTAPAATAPQEMAGLSDSRGMAPPGNRVASLSTMVVMSPSLWANCDSCLFKRPLRQKFQHAA